MIKVSAKDRLILLGKNSDAIMAVAVVAILLLMIMPVPPYLLDILFAFSLTFGLLILLVSMYILKPLDFSAFPSVLLIATLFRLSLSVASTRRILLHGYEGPDSAGEVIKAFGEFVVGGNYVVGAIVFVILIIINLIVITKGASRIGEVAARFTLDAMPGKQMSIDADLNAGLINESEAKQRRTEVSREADFYGAMDGACKFVKGDAIAGIIIVIIDIIGGLAIGVLQHGMKIGQAAQTYTLLTVGDGLVTQIPALVIATAAGIVVSSAGSENNVGKEITGQISLQPKALAIASLVLFGLALIPGLPTIPFSLLAVATGGIAYLLIKASKKKQTSKGEPSDKAASSVGITGRNNEQDTMPLLDILGLDVGYGLIPLVDGTQGGELLDRIKSIRRQMAQNIGVVIPPVHIQDNMQLNTSEYVILLKGNEVARGELMLHHCMAMDPGTARGEIHGIPTTEPTYGLPALWIKERDRETALGKGYTVVDLSAIIITHLSEIIKKYAHEILGRQEVQQLLDSLRESHPKVVEELIPNVLSVGNVGKVLQNLLREQIPIRDLLTIMETLADWAPMIKDVDALTEYVRQALSRTITKMYQASDGSIPLLTLDQRIESMISASIQRSEEGSFLAMEPRLAQRIIENVVRYMGKFSEVRSQPVILCSVNIRSHLKRLIDRFLPNIVVLSYGDILNTVKIQSLGTVVMADAD